MMNLRFDNLFILLGLFALAVPILLHLLKRRRFDVLDWGAMQFLPECITVHQRRWLDELLLMLVRLGMIAFVVLALATPISTSGWLDGLGGGRTRDIVLVFDGAYGMGARVLGQTSPWDDAIRQAAAQLDEAAAGDRFAILIARQPPHFQLEEFSGDLDEVRTQLQSLPPPRGNSGLPGALAEAWQRLREQPDARASEIRVFTDQRRQGWADSATLTALESLGNQWRADIERARIEGGAMPSLRVVTVGADLSKRLPNYALTPLMVSPRVAKVGQKVAIQCELRMEGFDNRVLPRKARVLVDGTPVGELVLPRQSELKRGPVSLTHVQLFEKVGQYVVSFQVEAEATSDVLSVDNEQHAVVDVVKDLPVLLVDGDWQLSPQGSSFFVHEALASRDARTKNARSVPYLALKPVALLAEDLDAIKPAVVVLADVPRLDTAQLDALDRYLADGGGLFIALGERAAHEQAFYNQQPWMPVKLAGIGIAKDGVQPESRKFQHPALERFREGAMAHVRFVRWTKTQLAANDRAAIVGTLSNGEPLFIEKPYKEGRVILATVPMDRRWDSTLPSASEFPILMHELMHYLAGASASSGVLHKGAPLQLSPGGAVPLQLNLKTPEREESTIDIKQSPWTYRNTGAIGVYQTRAADGRKWSFVVRPELDGSNLTRCSDDELRQVRARLPIVWQSDTSPSATDDSDGTREELWWLFLLTVLGLLCVEVWMTRRMVLARGR